MLHSTINKSSTKGSSSPQKASFYNTHNGFNRDHVGNHQIRSEHHDTQDSQRFETHNHDHTAHAKVQVSNEDVNLRLKQHNLQPIIN